MRVLFTSTSGWGHVHPMVPLAKAFLDRGDEVLWATGDEVCGRLEREGIVTSVAGLDDGVAMARFHDRYPEVSEVPPPERSDFMFPRLFGTVRAEQMLADLLPIARAYSPDLLVCDAAEFAGPIAAAVVRTPNVTLSFGATLPAPGRGHRTCGRAALGRPRPRGPALRWHLRPPVPGHLPTEHAAGRPTAHPGHPTDAARLVRNRRERTTTHLGHGGLVRPARVRHPRYRLQQRRRALRRHRGSSWTRGARCRRGETRGEPEALGPRPDNVHVARYIPQAQLLEHCSLVVSHAGSGTLLAALAAELPQVCLPQAADQFFNAAASAKAGAGIALAPDAHTAAAVSDAVGKLLTEGTYREAARRVSGEIAAMPSPTEVADKLHAAYG